MNAYETIKDTQTGSIIAPSSLPGSDDDVHAAVTQALRDDLIELVFQPMVGGEWDVKLSTLRHLPPDQIRIGFKRL